MVPYWFERRMPASRTAIENEVRLGLWGAGFGGVYVTCVQDHSPYLCEGNWEGQPFTMEWVPMDYMILRMAEPIEDLLTCFERILAHKALAAYRDASNQVVVEWRVKGLAKRYEALSAAGTKELEKLS